ncbi:MAG: beta-lactamase family protein [Solirubrobacterales bacterium]|nr:beta-lactamase family protein [Solirubrobacterales bacterium]
MQRHETIDHLDAVIRDRVDSGRSEGIAAGMIFAGADTHVVAHGDAGGGRRLDADSVFEIGSITKLFTGTLLAAMAHNGEVQLSDPVASLLPAGVSVPALKRRQITLEDLATHSSGLPRDPTTLGPGSTANPYSDYSADALYEFLAGHELAREPGSRVEYSNLATGLLGHALALRAGTTYGELVRERILQPLGMTSTAVTPSAQMDARAAIGHDARGRPIPAWLWGKSTLAGAGALRSTIGDMLRFAAANLDDEGSPLQRAMAAAQAPQKRMSLGMRVGLNWHVLGSGDRTLLLHSGATGGFFSSIGIRPAHQTAIVVLSNSRRDSVEDIALHYLHPRIRLTPAPKQRKAITLAPEVLDSYAGEYDLAGTIVRVTRAPEGLSVHVPGEPEDLLYPESRTRFFFKEMNAQVRMKRDLRRRVSGAVLHQDGVTVAVRKVS